LGVEALAIALPSLLGLMPKPSRMTRITGEVLLKEEFLSMTA
jgi:hypothetical protein